MPIVDITLLEGRTDEKKKAMMAAVTDAIEQSLDAPRDSIRIMLREVPARHFAVAGKTKDE
jgi:4-oxalocrotonate tautomerase